MTGFRLVEHPPPDDHRCPVPLREKRYYLPAAWAEGGRTDLYHAVQVPDGHLGDVWQCATCVRCWRLRHNPGQTRGGYSPAYDEWVRISRWRARWLSRWHAWIGGGRWR